MATPQIVTDGVIAGVATGIGAGLVAWVISLFRSRHLSSRLGKLEDQAEKDKAFKMIVIKSQMTQIDLFQLILDRQGIACEDCPAKARAMRDDRTQKVIDDSRKELNNYLGGLA